MRRQSSRRLLQNFTEKKTTHEPVTIKEPKDWNQLDRILRLAIPSS